MTKSEEAVRHVLRQVQNNPRLAYFIAPFSGCYETLTEARAETLGMDVDEYRREFEKNLKIEPWPKDGGF